MMTTVAATKQELIDIMLFACAHLAIRKVGVEYRFMVIIEINS